MVDVSVTREGGVQVARGPNGYQCAVVPRTASLFVRVVGNVYAPFAHLAQEFLDPWARLGQPIHLAVDSGALASYDPAFRQAWMEWFRDNREQLETCDLLVGNALVALGVGAVNRLIGGVIRTHHDQAKFDEAVGDAMGVDVAALRKSLVDAERASRPEPRSA